jgi:hypothetical protein
VPADIAQQFHPLARQDTRKRIPDLEREMTFMESLTVFRTMPGVNETAGRLLFRRAADRDLHVAHLLSRKTRTSAQKEAI